MTIKQVSTPAGASWSKEAADTRSDRLGEDIKELEAQSTDQMLKESRKLRDESRSRMPVLAESYEDDEDDDCCPFCGDPDCEEDCEEEWDEGTDFACYACGDPECDGDCEEVEELEEEWDEELEEEDF